MSELAETYCADCGATTAGDELCGRCGIRVDDALYGRAAPRAPVPRRRRQATRHRPDPPPPATLRVPAVAPLKNAMCGDVCPTEQYYVCTKRPDHYGEHEAHGEPLCVLASWPREGGMW